MRQSPRPFADKLDSLAEAVSFQAQTSTRERPLAPAPTTMSGTRSALILATLRDTPPWKLEVAVLKGVKLAAAAGTVVGVDAPGG